MGAAVDGKEHVSNLSLGPDAFRIRKMEGIGPTEQRIAINLLRRLGRGAAERAGGG